MPSTSPSKQTTRESAICVCMLLLCGFMTACSGGTEVAGFVAADNPGIRYTGRWNHDDPRAPRVGWQGSTVSIQFVGSEISAELDFGGEGERLRIMVDGIPEEPARLVAGGRQTILLARNLRCDAEHSVTLMKEEYATSTMTFYGFDIGGGEIAEMPPRPTMRIAFFGDSNMEGYSLYSEKNDGTNGTWFAYPATVARMLGAEMQLQAVGSATLDGPTPNDVVSLVHSEFYGSEDPAYRDDYDPQVIVVNAGANDIYQVDPEQRKEATKQHYRDAVRTLRRMYGENPHIVLMNAYAWDVDEPAMYSHEIVQELGGKLSTFLFPWCWEQWHGDMVDHSGQAGQLAKYIVSLDLGFAIQRDLDVVDGYGAGYDVANGSFEGAARDAYGGFGWRYHADGVERLAVADAADGDYVIRLDTGQKVHQCVDASGDFLPGATSGEQQYSLTAAIRSIGEAGTAVLAADYERQNLYRRENLEEHEFVVTGDWQDYTAILTAPNGSWKTYVILRSGSGNIEFDNIRLDGISPAASGRQLSTDSSTGR